MKKTGLVLAAAAASLFVVGCATQADSSAASQPTPVAAQPMDNMVAPHYKGGNGCKHAKKHHVVKHHAVKKAEKTASATTETTTTTADATKTAADATTTQ